MIRRVHARVAAAGSVVFVVCVFLAGCGGTEKSTTSQSPVLPQGTFVYVGEQAASPDSVFPTDDMDALASYQVQADGSLKRLGAFDRSALPFGIFRSASAGPWVFVCDANPVCQEFKIDGTGNLVHGSDISQIGLNQIAGIDPSGNWLIASNQRGEFAFRIQGDGSLVAGPATPASLPAPPGSLGPLGFFIITFDPTGNFVFARTAPDLGDPPAVFRFDSSTGVFTRVSSLPPDLSVPGFRFLGFSSDGRHALGFQNSTEELYVLDWDPAAGILGVHSHGVFSLNNGTSLFVGAIAAADNFIFVPQDVGVVLRLDPASGTVSDTGQRYPTNGALTDQLHADLRTHTLVGTDSGGNLIGAWKYDAVTGATTIVPGSPYASGLNPMIVGVLAH